MHTADGHIRKGSVYLLIVCLHCENINTKYKPQEVFLESSIPRNIFGCVSFVFCDIILYST